MRRMSLGNEGMQGLWHPDDHIATVTRGPVEDRMHILFAFLHLFGKVGGDRLKLHQQLMISAEDELVQLLDVPAKTKDEYTGRLAGPRQTWTKVQTNGQQHTDNKTNERQSARKNERETES